MSKESFVLTLILLTTNIFNILGILVVNNIDVRAKLPFDM